ncbi:MAG: Rrf2 family transcriptional regulator [Proteobacteria bacterium]|nr:Rrf2 family transcriptional regulator [Pseudomonadota bacterium]
MQLSKFTDYGLRLLMQLVAMGPERVSVKRIATTFQISEHHMAKVASELVRGGFILSGRGRNGGLTLAKDPADILIGDVVRHLSGDVPVVECFKAGSSDCRARDQCGLRGPLHQAQQAFYTVLDAYTLDDVVARRDLMKQLLCCA